MKALEQLVIRARSRWRSGQARLGGAPKPARLDLRLDDFDAPAPLGSGTPLTLDGWFDAIVRVVEWTGALPVHVVSHANNPLLTEVVRFAHRLECPTTLRTSAAGISRIRAEVLVDNGLDRIVLRTAGVSDGVQQAVLGESVADTRAAVAALQAARASRAAGLDIVLEIPFEARTAPEIQALYTEARSAGVDGVRVAAPWRGGPFSGEVLDVLGWVGSQGAPFSRTDRDTLAALPRMKGEGAGVARTRGACPVASLRLELRADGTLVSCPFQPGATPIGDALAPAWESLAAHRDAVQRCDRACVHPDLTA